MAEEHAKYVALKQLSIDTHVAAGDFDKQANCSVQAKCLYI